MFTDRHPWNNAHVDDQPQKRVPKDSFDGYQQVIASNGKNLLGEPVMPAAQVTPA